jgi:hypothetical protein
MRGHLPCIVRCTENLRQGRDSDYGLQHALSVTRLSPGHQLGPSRGQRINPAAASDQTDDARRYEQEPSHDH